MEKFVKELMQSQIKLMQEIETKSIIKFSNFIINASKKNKNVFFMGNGGSAATASHICADFNRYLNTKKTKKSMFYCLNDSIALITSIANDLSYENIYTEQLKGLLQKGDVIVAISGKGNSLNVNKAVEFGNKNNAVTLSLCGFDGGKLLKSSSFSIHVKNSDMQVVENTHIIILHAVMKLIISYFKEV